MKFYFIVLLYGLLCLPTIITVSAASMPPCSSQENEGRERAVFHFSNSLIVGSPLLEFIPMVTLGERGVVINLERHFCEGQPMLCKLE